MLHIAKTIAAVTVVQCVQHSRSMRDWLMLLPAFQPAICDLARHSPIAHWLHVLGPLRQPYADIHATMLDYVLILPLGETLLQ